MNKYEYKILIIGMGNLLMSDDGAGIRVIRELLEIKWPGGVSVIEIGTDPFAYLDEISQSFCLIAVDVITAGGIPGTIYRIDIYDETEKTTLTSNQPKLNEYPAKNSHTFSLLDIVTLARDLTGLPEKLTIFGIEPAKILPGTDLSRTVSKVVASLKEQIILEISRFISI